MATTPASGSSSLGALGPYVDAIRDTLIAAICIENFASMLVVCFF